MKFLLLPILFLLVTITSNAAEKKSIKLPEGYIVKDLFSCKLESQESFHFVIARNKINSLYSLLPVFPQDKDLKVLHAIEFKNKPSLVSYHNNGNVLTVVLSIGTKGIQTFFVLDVNISSKETFKSEPYKDKYFKTAIRKNYETLLLFCNGSELKIRKILNSKYVEHIIVKHSDKTFRFLVNSNKFNCSGINLDEYVANGSVNRFTAYSIDDELILTEDNTLGGYSSVLKLPLNDGDLNNVSHLTFNVNYKKVKSLSSYYHDDTFYQLALNKEAGNLMVHNLVNKTNTIYDLNNVNIHYSGTDFSSIQDFVYAANMLNNKLTITVNETLDLNRLVRIDYVSSQSYSYHNNWYLNQRHHDEIQGQFQREHDQIIQNSIQNRKFGPSVIDEISSYQFYAKVHFEVLLDLDSKDIINDSDITFYRNLDKKQLVNEFEEFNARNCISSSVFSNEWMYNFIYNQKTSMLTLYKTAV